MLLQGILLGLSLSFLVGPLLFAIVEAGIAQGFRAGVAVAAGIWASDLLYVLVAFYGIGAMEALVALPHFKTWAGLAGGLLLAAFGAISIWKARVSSALTTSSGQNSPATEQTRPDPIVQATLSGQGLIGQTTLSRQTKPYFWWWLRGFLLNTVNPGTLFFWLGIISAVVVPSGWSHSEMMIFFSGMLGTLVLTDTLKAWAAKKLRHFLTPLHTRQVQRFIGLLLIVFGLVLIAKVFVDVRHF